MEDLENEKSSFVKLFGDYPSIRVIDFMMTFREFDYPLTEIAQNAGVAWSTIHTFFPELVRLGVVKETRQIGRARLYKLNVLNPIVKELIALDNRLIQELAEDLTTEKIVARTKRASGPRSMAGALKGRISSKDIVEDEDHNI